MNSFLENTRISSFKRLPSPDSLKEKFPLSLEAKNTVLSTRNEIQKILHGISDKFLVVVGPCSIHNISEALIYAEKLVILSRKFQDKMVIVMRTYMEKPRTGPGWKGFFRDPYLDNSYNINDGLEKGREFLVHLADMGLPAAVEALDTDLTHYISDVVSLSSIGARTIRSQSHRDMASGLSMPAGFKNDIYGNIDSALYAIAEANKPSAFKGIDGEGYVSRVATKGNPDSFLILRGGENGFTNFDEKSVNIALSELLKSRLDPYLLIDCSHGNSQKIYDRQPGVCDDVIRQRIAGNKGIVGVMIESYLKSGSRQIPDDLSKVDVSKIILPGVSITDGCLGWEETEDLLFKVYRNLKD